MKKSHLVVTLALMTQLAACGDENTNTWCDNHNSVHQDHLDSITLVKVLYSENGDLRGTVTVPQTDATEMSLSKTEDIFNISAASSCYYQPAKVAASNKKWQAEYKIECGTNNKLESVSIAVLENFPAVSEIEVYIETPATKKHFVLNRQCERPIFML